MSGKLNREELAALEVGRTTISRPLAQAIVLCFILLICSVPVTQTVLDSRNLDQQSLLASLRILAWGDRKNRDREKTFTANLKQNNTRLLERMDNFERGLEKGSFLRNLLLAPGQRFLLALGHGNEKVYPGQENWLFFRPDMDYLMGSGFLDEEILEQRRTSGKMWEKAVQPDPLQAIQEFQLQLVERGIKLILMPTPVKASLHPEKFAAGRFHPPLQNRSWPDFLAKIKQTGIPLFDPAPILFNYQQQEKNPGYLQTDTHWRPEAMEEVAEQLADFVKKESVLQGIKKDLQRKEVLVKNRGDIDAMLLLPDTWDLYKQEQVLIHSVLTKGNELWQPSSEAEILLLGDSFSNIYSLAGMDWGEGAGLGEQLSYFLDQPVDVLLQNDSGAYATRELLSAELARGRDRLAGKKIVVWQFATRELASGDWKTIPMLLREREESDFYIPAPEERKKVTAIVAAISSSPLPGSVPYKDNIVTLHLVDIRDSTGDEEYGQALIYGWGMQDNSLTPLARVRVGEQITLELVDWDMVQRKYSSYRRSTLDDEMLELELPVWGEMVQ